ncbi:hypothetical protein PR048_004368 [Dryococelus australis]|uniref:Uncharacterized protein n=1 Tax=Dryococelus australis TaxID=614101 RepID=A0ABQ9I581_9NEOP|nr:hypothetical protein PR048_004368 [Dryococelus australis]
MLRPWKARIYLLRMRVALPRTASVVFTSDNYTPPNVTLSRAYSPFVASSTFQILVAFGQIFYLHARLPPRRTGFEPRPGHRIFRKWESCRTMPLVGRFSRGSPVSSAPPPQFRRCSIFTSVTLLVSQDLAVKSHPNLFTHSLYRIHHTCVMLSQENYSPTVQASRVRSPAKSPPYFRTEIAPLVGGFSRAYPVAPSPPSCIPALLRTQPRLALIGSHDLGVPAYPDFFCPAFEAENDKGDTATRIKCSIAAKHGSTGVNCGCDKGEKEMRRGLGRWRPQTKESARREYGKEGGGGGSSGCRAILRCRSPRWLSSSEGGGGRERRTSRKEASAGTRTIFGAVSDVVGRRIKGCRRWMWRERRVRLVPRRRDVTGVGTSPPPPPPPTLQRQEVQLRRQRPCRWTLKNTFFVPTLRLLLQMNFRVRDALYLLRAPRTANSHPRFRLRGSQSRRRRIRTIGFPEGFFLPVHPISQSDLVCAFVLRPHAERKGRQRLQRCESRRRQCQVPCFKGCYAVVRRQQCSLIGLARPESRPQPYRTYLGRIASPRRARHARPKSIARLMEWLQEDGDKSPWMFCEHS